MSFGAFRARWMACGLGAAAACGLQLTNCASDARTLTLEVRSPDALALDRLHVTLQQESTRVEADWRDGGTLPAAFRLDELQAGTAAITIEGFAGGALVHTRSLQVIVDDTGDRSVATNLCAACACTAAACTDMCGVERSRFGLLPLGPAPADPLPCPVPADMSDGGTDAGRQTPGAIQIEADVFNNTCALLEDRSIRCWGENGNYALGQGPSPDPFVRPAPAIDFDGRAVTRFAFHFETGCAVLDSGRVRCWGKNQQHQASPVAASPLVHAGAFPAIELPPDVRAVDVAVGSGSACALLETGKVWCWGDQSGQSLGIEDAGTPFTPSPVAWPSAAGQLAHGAVAACVGATSPGPFACWGANALGRNGLDAGEGTTPEPVALAAPSFKLVSLGTDTAVALTDDGSLWGWGKNDDGCAGTLVVDGNAWLGAPTPGSSLRPDLRFVAASMGNDHAALVDGDGNGWVIGAVVNAVRGDGAQATATSQFFRVGDPDDGAVRWRALTAGNKHTCGLTEDKRVYCWGKNTPQGLLGIGAVSGADGNEISLPRRVVFP